MRRTRGVGGDGALRETAPQASGPTLGLLEGAHLDLGQPAALSLIRDVGEGPVAGGEHAEGPPPAVHNDEMAVADLEVRALGELHVRLTAGGHNCHCHAFSLLVGGADGSGGVRRFWWRR